MSHGTRKCSRSLTSNGWLRRSRTRPARGPVWDALARCTLADGTAAVILAEGKNYPREMYSGGTQAGKSGSEERKPVAARSSSRSPGHKASSASASTWAAGSIRMSRALRSTRPRTG